MRGLLYDVALVPLTGRWYRAVLERLPDGARLLDIGIGTAGALVENAALLREKRLHVTGLDIDADYVARGTKRIIKARLEDLVDVRLESVYDHEGGPYDAAYFSASFMILPDRQRALDIVRAATRPPHPIYFTMTIEEKRSELVEKTKPLLKKVTTVEFGRVTYESEFRAVLADAGFGVVEDVRLGGNKRRTARLFVARST